MGCCVVGREDVDTLQSLLVPLVEGVVDKQVQIPTWEDPPYSGV